jgi:hypothetical protein
MPIDAHMRCSLQALIEPLLQAWPDRVPGKYEIAAALTVADTKLGSRLFQNERDPIEFAMENAKKKLGLLSMRTYRCEGRLLRCDARKQTAKRRELRSEVQL